MGQSLKGRPYSGKLETPISAEYERVDERFVTVAPLGENRAALDTIAHYFILKGATARVAEALSDDKQIVLTAHGAIAGNAIQLLSTTNNITQTIIYIRSIIDANTIELEGVLDADISIGDTFDILEFGLPRIDVTGAVTVTSTPTPLIFTLDGADQEVVEDTGTPSLNRALPVKLLDVTGDINITAGDLNVQLSHTGASPDSTQVGDGTEILLISTAGEALTLPSGNVADNAADSGNPIKVGGVFNSAPPTYDDGDRADLQVDAAGSLKVADVVLAAANDHTKAEDAASAPGDVGSYMLSVRQDTPAGDTSADGDYQSVKSDATGHIYVSDSAAQTALGLVATEATLAAQSAKLPATLGQKAMVASMAVVIASDQSTIAVSQASQPLPTGAATEATLASIAAEDFATQTTLALVATEATLAAQSAKLPATLGQKTGAASMAVVPASDYTPPAPVGRTAIDTARLDYSGTPVTTGAFVELIASVASGWNEMEIFDSSGQTLELAFGAVASEVVQIFVLPGGNGRIPLLGASGTRVSLKAVSATANAGEISVNFYS